MPVPLSARDPLSFDLILITLIPASCRSTSNHHATKPVPAQAVLAARLAAGCPIPDTRLYGGGQGHS
jgi:hypothetical protein